MIISHHAIEQFKKRSGSRKSNQHIIEQLTFFINHSKEARPVGNYGAVQLLNHGLKPATYLEYGGWIMVVQGNVLKTIHQNESKRFRIKEK